MNKNKILGIIIILTITFFITLLCIIITQKIFKNNNLKTNKNFRKNLSKAISDSFFSTSIFSILIALIIYTSLKNILLLFNLKNGLINYTVFISKIWFVSAPFIGLEITILKYFKEIEFSKKIVHILSLKIIIYLILCLILSFKYSSNYYIYSKPICDIIFLFYYTKICFELTLK